MSQITLVSSTSIHVQKVEYNASSSNYWETVIPMRGKISDLSAKRIFKYARKGGSIINTTIIKNNKFFKKCIHRQKTNSKNINQSSSIVKHPSKGSSGTTTTITINHVFFQVQRQNPQTKDIFSRILLTYLKKGIDQLSPAELADREKIRAQFKLEKGLI